MTPMLALVTVSIRQALPTRRTALLLLAELGPAAVYLLATSNRTAVAAFDGLVEIGASTYFGLVLPVVRRQPMHSHAFDIDPVQDLFVGNPNRRLANFIRNAQHMFDFAHKRSPLAEPLPDGD